MTFIELSHMIEDGMTTYPGLPCPAIRDFLAREDSESKYAPGTTFQMGRIDMIANTGTYVDAPFHRFVDGPDLADLPLERLADLDGVLVDAIDAAEAESAIGPESFAGIDVAGKAVLVRTDWSKRWRTPAYGEGHPFLTGEAAELLAERGAAFVGIDSLNIDDATDGMRPVHTRLLGECIPIGEHLTNLAALPGSGFRFHAAPVRVRGMGSFPVRAYAIV